MKLHKRGIKKDMLKNLSKLLILLGVFNLVACQSSENSDTEGAANVESTITVPPISVQLWSVKDAVKADFKGTLTQLAAMGFNGVEFAGDYGPFKDDPEGLKAFLTSLGLKASGAHVGFKQVKSDDFEKTLAFLQKIDAKLVNIGADSRAWQADGVHELTEDLTSYAKLFAKYDLVFGYHNHDHEFNSYKGSTYWDYIAQNTAENVGLQLDIGWVNYAGKDPLEYVKRYPNRTLTTHIKVRTQRGSEPKRSTQPVTLGQDGYDWATLIKAMVEHGGTQWLVLEQEEYPAGLTPMQAVEQSKLGLDAIVAKM